MNLKKWLYEQGISMYALARMCNLSRITIRNLVIGKNASVRTVKKLTENTRNMKNPITYEMFPKIRGKKKPK